MAGRVHHYALSLQWLGKRPVSAGALDYKTYSRELQLSIPDKKPIVASADPNFAGDPKLHNPEDLLLCSVASCHFLSYLSICARNGVSVVDYQDQATAEMAYDAAIKTFRFTKVVLHPTVSIAPASDPALASKLHHDAHAACFIAQSVNFPIECEPRVIIASD